MAAAVWLLGDPGSTRRLLLLAATGVVVLGLDWPRVGDHLLIVLAASLGIAALALALRTLDGDVLWTGLAPLLRATAVLLYAAAAFAKLNEDFLDPDVSEAGPIVMRLPFAGDWAVEPAIAGAILTEATLAVLLAVPRTRRAGVVLGLLFHAVLAVAGNVPFAAVMAAVYVAFVGGPRLPRLSPAVVGAVWIAGAVVDPAPGVAGAWLGEVLRWGVAAALVVAALRVGPSVSPGRGLHPALAGVLIALTLNAAAPYLGLKRLYVFAPFSNLRTQPGEWNHLVVPERVRLAQVRAPHPS